MDGWSILTSISAFCGALFTLAIAIIALVQLRKTNNIAAADFYHRFKIDFFTEKERLLIGLISIKGLIFDEKKACFIVDNKKILSLTEDMRNQAKEAKGFSQEEVDDFLLGHFEDLGLFFEMKIIPKKFVVEGFRHYIKTVYEDEQIKKYIQWCHEKHGDGIYSKLKALYEELTKKEARKSTF